MYSLGIYLMALGVRVAALFKEKLRKMVQGHRATW